MADVLRSGFAPRGPFTSPQRGEGDDPHPNPLPYNGRETAEAEPLGFLPPERGELEGGHAQRECLTRREAFAAAARRLREAGLATPELDARLLLCHAAGVGHEALVATPELQLTLEQEARLRALVTRRLAGEPVSRIVGAREFYGREFRIDPHVLDPRPDTETLVEAALQLVEQAGWRDRPVEILDLGVGSGAILLTLLAELPNVRGLGTDKSLPALDIARVNAEALGLTKRVNFLAGDWFAPLGKARFDLIVSNPPYLSASEMDALTPEVAHDPAMALNGGEDGLDAYRAIAKGAPLALKPGGAILLEIGATQGGAVLSLLRGGGLKAQAPDDGLRRDLAGRPRCLVARGG